MAVICIRLSAWLTGSVQINFVAKLISNQFFFSLERLPLNFENTQSFNFSCLHRSFERNFLCSLNPSGQYVHLRNPNQYGSLAIYHESPDWPGFYLCSGRRARWWMKYESLKGQCHKIFTSGFFHQYHLSPWSITEIFFNLVSNPPSYSNLKFDWPLNIVAAIKKKLEES